MARRKRKEKDITMPSLEALQKSSPCPLFAQEGNSDGWACSSTEEVSPSQLHEFWSRLSLAARRELLGIDKHALFEQVRKSLYCSGCRDLIGKQYAQIVSYWKNSQVGALGFDNGLGACNKCLSEDGTNGETSNSQDQTEDPSVHPWGGLIVTSDNILTVLECFLDGTPIEVFKNAHARELERQSLYPDACGGEESFGVCRRGPRIKGTCSLHAARVSCEALADFWSTLGEETRKSLTQMPEEDFTEQIKLKFMSEEFCQDCRPFVLDHFRLMKDLKQKNKIWSCCTRWFCGVYTSHISFEFQVSDSMVEADWRDCFPTDGDSVYQRFEFSLGTAECKEKILAFDAVGLRQRIQVKSLDLANMTAVYLTVRGWKSDGQCIQHHGKAQALKGRLCAHQRLTVGDGHVSITEGESIQQFLKSSGKTVGHGQGSRPKEHATSPELALDILQEAATLIFKEQVEKAFREDAARKSARTIFVCLSASLLEERVRVGFKEIAALEKQKQLLEEAEDEKRKEKERKERKTLKEKVKKLRRKEKMAGKGAKEKCKGIADVSSEKTPKGSISGVSDHIQSDPEEGNSAVCDIDSISARSLSPDMAETRPLASGLECGSGAGGTLDSSSSTIHTEDDLSMSSFSDGDGALIVEGDKSPKRRSQRRQIQQSEESQNKQSKREIMDAGGSQNALAVTSFGVQNEIINLQVEAEDIGKMHEADGRKCMDSWHPNGDAHQVWPQGSVHEKKLFAEGPSTERNGEMQPKKTYSDVMEVPRKDHFRSALRGELVGTMPNNGHGLPDCTFVHSANEYGVFSKPLGPLLLGSYVDDTLSHTKGKPARPTERAQPESVVYRGKLGIAAASKESILPVGEAPEQGTDSQNISNPMAFRNPDLRTAKRVDTSSGGKFQGRLSALDLGVSKGEGKDSTNVNESQARPGILRTDANGRVLVGNCAVSRPPRSVPNCLHTMQLQDSNFLSNFEGGCGGGTDSRIFHPGKRELIASAYVPQTAAITQSQDSVSAPGDRKDPLIDSPVQVDRTGFSFFHFLDPAVVIQNSREWSAFVDPYISQ